MDSTRKYIEYLIVMMLLMGPVLLKAQADTTAYIVYPVGHDTTKYGYPEVRPVERIGGSQDDLARSFPKEGAIFKKITPPKLATWKTELYDKTGIKLALSYQISILGA